MRLLQPLVGRLERVTAVLAAVALAGFTAIIIVEVSARFLLGVSFFWANEAATYLFVYSVFFGSSVALSRGQLMGIAELREALPDPVRRLLSMASHLLIAGFCGLACATSLQLWSHAWSRGAISPALEIPMHVVYLPLPLGFALMALFALNLLAAEIAAQLAAIRARAGGE
ncbi:MAG: TRAP transporter small permease [Alphaproteobacteria bacterium]|nr:MAG: TRAP transporter small permease [Alphaproteobacteria bacterium]